MSEKLIQEQITSLTAKVTALMLLLESLWVQELEKAADPAKASKIIIDDHFDKFEKLREKLGESAYVLQVSDAVTSFLDRAVAKAVLRKSKEGR